MILMIKNEGDCMDVVQIVIVMLWIVVLFGAITMNLLFLAESLSGALDWRSSIGAITITCIFSFLIIYYSYRWGWEPLHY
jgi:hypothetical protein